jgi:glyoxylase I family protein
MRAGTFMIDLLDINGPIGGGTKPDQQRANSDHFCLRITPFDTASMRDHLVRHRVESELPAQDRYGAEGTGLSLYIRDPDGNRIELKAALTS